MESHLRIVRSRRGGASTALALLLSMIVVVSLVQNIFIKNQYVTDEDRERLQEYISIDLIFFDVNENLVISVQNTGAVNTRLVAVWIRLGNSSDQTQRFTVNKYLGPDQTQEVVITAVELSSFVSITDDFTVTVYTERGNLVAETYSFIEPSPVGNSNPPLGHLGILRVNWFYSRYSSLQALPDPVYGPLVQATYIQKSEDYVAFYIRLKNAWDHPIKLQEDSFVALTSIAPPQGAGEPNFFLVQGVDYSENKLDPQISVYEVAVNPIILYPNQTKTLCFASEGIDMSSAWRWGYGYPFGSETKREGSGIQATIFFEIYDYDTDEKRWIPSGKYGGQTISTQAIILAPSE